MVLKINKKKYKNVDFPRVNKLVKDAMILTHYNIVVEKGSNWLQVINDRGSISLVHQIDNKVSYFYKYLKENKIREIIKAFCFNEDLGIEQNPNEVRSITNFSIYKIIGSLFLFLSLIILLLAVMQENSLDIGLLLFSIGLIISSSELFMLNKIDIKKIIIFIGGVCLFVYMIFKIYY